MFSNLLAKLKAGYAKYPREVHFILWLWNIILTSWMLGPIPVDLTSILGFPYTYVIDVRSLVSHLQALAHIPTWFIGLVTFALNAGVAFRDWKSKQIKQAATAAVLVAALALCTVGITGCTDFERKTFQTLSASKALIDSAAVDYEVGKLPHTVATKTAIDEARKSQVAAVQAFQTYSALKAAGSDTSSQVATVTTAINSLTPLIAALKALYLSPSTTKGN